MTEKGRRREGGRKETTINAKAESITRKQKEHLEKRHAAGKNHVRNRNASKVKKKVTYQDRLTETQWVRSKNKLHTQSDTHNKHRRAEASNHCPNRSP